MNFVSRREPKASRFNMEFKCVTSSESTPTASAPAFVEAFDEEFYQELECTLRPLDMFDPLLPAIDIADDIPLPPLFGEVVEPEVEEVDLRQSVEVDELSSEEDVPCMTVKRPVAAIDDDRSSDELWAPGKGVKRRRIECDYEEYTQMIDNIPKSNAGRKKKSVTTNMTKNALAARENRDRKQVLVEKLKQAVYDLCDDNRDILSRLDYVEEKNRYLEEMMNYYKSVIARLQSSSPPGSPFKREA